MTDEMTMLNAQNTRTKDQLLKMKKFLISLEKYCHYCGFRFHDDIGPGSRLVTIDHKIPLSRGGGEDIENKVVCCMPCNVEKGSLTYHEYIRIRACIALGNLRL